VKIMLNMDESNDQLRLFNPSSYWYKILLVLIFVLATLIRLDDIKALGHLVEREYNSAIFARAFYFERNDGIEKWRQENARLTRDQLPLLEPPVTEYLVSLVYRIVGREEIWYSRYLTSIFWLIGGAFLYKIVKILISADAALYTLIYYLFAPWGIIISRSFQPDSLMMMLFMISLYCILSYFKNLSWRMLILAAVITGMTLLFRPLVLFTLLGAFIVLSFQNKKGFENIFDKRLIVFCILSLAFPFAFYGWGIYVAGFLRSQADLSFRPWLLTQWKFWLGWLNLGTMVAGPSVLVAALLGYFVAQNRLLKYLISGLFIGYFVFGIFFTFHIYTHPYYHIQLIPIVGISSAPLILYIGALLKKSIHQYWLMPAAAILLFGLYFSYSEVRGSLYQTYIEDPSAASEIGEIVNHSPRTVFVAYHYGLPLEYYGEFSGAPWPVRIDDPFLRDPNEKARSVQERLDSLGFQPEYFVITNFDLFNRKHQDLKSYLVEKCSVFVKTDRFLIYRSCSTNSVG
jgi:hypothetical protein